ncbi:MAG: hypothetical protein JNL57_12730 [Bacteroidetes bacterium]|nr:hypothetical protein [Bacteroidota bacterium]
MKHIKLYALIPAAFALSAAFSQEKPGTHTQVRKVIIVKKNTREDSLDRKKWEEYTNQWKRWSDSMGRLIGKAPIPPMPPMPPDMPIERIEVITDSSSRFLGIDSPIREEFVWSFPGGFRQMPMKPRIPKLLNEGELNLGFNNVANNTSFIGANPPSNLQAIPELNNLRSAFVGIGQNWGFNLYKGNWRLWFGLRYDISNYMFNDPNVRLGARQPQFSLGQDTLSENTQKSKLVANYLGAPIAIGYQSDPYASDEGFWMKAGVNAGYLVRSHTKVKADNGDKNKVFDDFNLNNFAITPFLCMGYNNLGLFVRVTTSPVFKSGEGNNANSYQFGIVMQ